MGSEGTLMQFFEMGGPFMWPLLAFSVATVALILERVVYLLFHDLRVDGVRQTLLELIRRKSWEEAENYLRDNKKRSVCRYIFLELINHAPYGEHRMEKAVEAEAGERIRNLERGFNYLSALASIAPLTGFLGTVSGMISAFRSIAEATDVNAQLVANGIYEALMTTVFGLIIAIVAMIGYNILAGRVDGFTADITKASSDLITAIVLEEDGFGEN